VLLFAGGLVLALASPAMAVHPAAGPDAPDQPLVWDAAAAIPEPRAANLVQCPDDPDGFYLVGGITTGNVTADTLYYFDAISNTWGITLTTMPQPRRGVAATCYEGKIYVAGGWAILPYNSFYIYDIAGDSWSVGPSLPDVLWGAALGAWNGKLYLVGGTRIGFPWTPVAQVDVYDIASGMWKPGARTAMPTAASFFGNAQRGPYLFAVGGASGTTNNVTTTQRYDMSSDTWAGGPQFSSQRVLVSLAITGERLYALGGDLNGVGQVATDLVEYLELSSWPGGVWTDLGDPLPEVNIYPASACTRAINGGEIWAVGGGLDTATVYSTTHYRTTEACLGYNYAFSLGPEAQSGEGFPGGMVTFSLAISNTGDMPDAYDLTVSGTWTTTISGFSGVLEPEETGNYTVTVDVSEEAAFGDSDIATVVFNSQGDPGMQLTATLTTAVWWKNYLPAIPKN
jgi:hypothetical protein